MLFPSVGSIKTSQIKLKYVVLNNNFLKIFPASMTARLKAVKKSSIRLIVVHLQVCYYYQKKNIYPQVPRLKFSTKHFFFYLTTKLTNFVFRSFITNEKRTRLLATTNFDNILVVKKKSWIFSWAMSHICANDGYRSQAGATNRPENIVIR
jgi:hypothetical protein